MKKSKIADIRVYKFFSKASIFCLALAFIPHARAQAQAPVQSGASWVLSVAPGISLPLSSAGLYDIGASTTASARFALGATPFSLGPEIGYVYQPLKNTNEFLSLMDFGAKARFDFRLSPWLQASPYGQGGYFIGMVREPPAGAPISAAASTWASRSAPASAWCSRASIATISVFSRAPRPPWRLILSWVARRVRAPGRRRLLRPGRRPSSRRERSRTSPSRSPRSSSTRSSRSCSNSTTTIPSAS